MSRDDRTTRQVRALEPIFHRTSPGAGRDELQALVTPDFFEVGASGSVYLRDVVLDEVARRYRAGTDPDDDAWQLTHFEARRLSPVVVLCTYHLTFRARTSRRATLWQLDDATWRAAYH